MCKWPDSGIIYCEKKDTWCMSVDIKTGQCKERNGCILYDPEYIKMKQEQREKAKNN